MVTAPLRIGQRYLVWVVALVVAWQTILEGIVAALEGRGVASLTWILGSIILFALAVVAERIKTFQEQ